MESVRLRLSESQVEMQTQDKKLRKSEKTTRRLQEELCSLQEHVQTSTVSHAEMGVYKKQVEEKVHLYPPHQPLLHSPSLHHLTTLPHTPTHPHPHPHTHTHTHPHTHTHTHTHTEQAGDVPQAGRANILHGAAGLYFSSFTSSSSSSSLPFRLHVSRR